eukprot:gene2070-2258_t
MKVITIPFSHADAMDWQSNLENEEEEEQSEDLLLLVTEKNSNELSDGVLESVSSTSSMSSSTLSKALATSSAGSPFMQHEEADLTLPPKRRIRRVNNSPFPKILRSDFRHKLSLMFTNTMNAVDSNMMKNFCDQFCLKGCNYLHCAKIEDSHDPCCSIYENYKPVRVYGIEGMVQRYATVCSYIPDYSLQLIHSYINREIGQPGSRIVMKVIAHATVLKHNMVAVRGIDQNRYFVPSFIVDELAEAGRVDVNNMGLEEHPPDALYLDLNMTGETVFWLDNHHRIYRIDSCADVGFRYHD